MRGLCMVLAVLGVGKEAKVSDAAVGLGLLTASRTALGETLNSVRGVLWRLERDHREPLVNLK